MKKSAATCAPASMPSTSTSTASPSEDADYILDTFPIVRCHDEDAFGNYRTKAMILAYFNALAAGDYDTEVIV